jgi:hypothetical protein
MIQRPRTLDRLRAAAIPVRDFEARVQVLRGGLLLPRLHDLVDQERVAKQWRSLPQILPAVHRRGCSPS